MAEPLLSHKIVASFSTFGDFDTISGGTLQTAVTDYTPAGATTADKLLGTTSTDNITLTRAFDPSRDNDLIEWYKTARSGADQSQRSVTKRMLNQIGAVIDSRTYGPCKPVSLDIPGGTSGDNSVANITLVLAVKDLL